MNFFLGIMIVGLLLTGCASTSEKSSIRKQKNEIFKYNATALLTKKENKWAWIGLYYRGAYHGFGNTPQEASDEATKICEKKKKTITKKTVYCLEPIIYIGRKHLGTMSNKEDWIEKLEKIKKKMEQKNK